MPRRLISLVKRMKEGTLTPRRLMNRLVLDLDEQMKSEFIHAYPGSLIIETINACNSTCKLCPVGEGRRSRPVRTLDMHTYCRFIDELGPYAESVTLNNWGEPLLDRYLV